MLCVLFALLTAGSNACAAVLQRKAAAQVPPERSMHISLLADLVHRRVWLAGIGMVVVAAVAQAAALATGPIALVQPIFIIELPVTLVLAALANHNRAALKRLPWAAIITTTAALGLGLAIAQPHGAIESAQTTSWIVVLIVTGAIEALLIASATGIRGEPRAALLGLAAACGYALTAALMKNAMADLEGGAGPVLHQLAHLRHRRGRSRLAVPAAERAPGRQPGGIAADAHRGRRADQHQLRRGAVQRGTARRLVARTGDHRARVHHPRLRADRQVTARPGGLRYG